MSALLPDRGRVLTASVGLIGVALLLGAAVWWLVDRPGGLAAQAGNDDLGSCLDDAGFDLEGVQEWDRSQERDVLVRPAALDCVLDTVPREEQDDTLARAFPEIGSTNDDYPLLEARNEALAAYVAGQPEDRPLEDVTRRAVRLMRLFDEIDRGPGDESPDPDAGLHAAFALHLREVGTPDAYLEFLGRTGRRDERESRLAFLAEQRDNGGQVGARIRRLAEELNAAR